MHGSDRVALALTLAGLACAACAQQGSQPGTTGSTPPATAAGGEFANAEQLLDALETADKDLTGLVADIKWERTFVIQGEREVRTGKLYYVAKPAAEAGKPPERKFAIRLDRLWVGDVERPQDRTYIFDGQWLMEKDGIERFFQKQQVVPPGEQFDPLKIGQGPMAIPIGQRKSEILRRFDAELRPVAEGLEPPADASEEERKAAGEQAGAVAGTTQLKLKPKPEFTEEEEFSEIRLWYRRSRAGDLLPRMARTVKKSAMGGPGDVSVVLLLPPEVQYAGRPENPKAKPPAEMIDTTPPEGWNGRVVPLERRQGPAGDAR